MDIALAGQSALEVIRGVRRNPNLRLEPSMDVNVSHFSYGRGELKGINYLAIGLSSQPTRARPITIRVSDAKGRNHAGNVHCLTFSKGCEHVDLLRPCIANPSSSDSLFGEGDVYVETIPAALLTVAASYQRLVRSGRLRESDAVIRLVELLMEFCGHYGRDPADPAGGEIDEDVAPSATVGQVQAFLETNRQRQGSCLLRKALRYACDGSRSAMETYLWIVLTMPASYGLFEFTSAKLNVALVPTEAQRSLMRHRTLTPDIQWAEMAVAIEYQGLDNHSSKAAMAEDNRRMNDYQVCGVRAFFVTFGDVRNVFSLDALVLEIAKAMRDHGFPNELRRVRRILEDVAGRSQRARHLAHLLPPVRGYDG